MGFFGSQAAQLLSQSWPLSAPAGGLSPHPRTSGPCFQVSHPPKPSLPLLHCYLSVAFSHQLPSFCEELAII